MERTGGRGSLPGFVTDLLAPLPRAPLGFALTRAMRDLARRRPELFDRLEALGDRGIAVLPSDLPFALRLEAEAGSPSVRVVGSDEVDDADARIRAPLVVLLGLLDGTYNGDALFLSGDLVVEANPATMVKLRGALEDAALTPAELAGLRGVLGRLLDRAAQSGLGVARRVLDAPAASDDDRKDG